MSPNRAQDAAALVGKSIGTVEGAAEVIGARTRQGIRVGASAVRRSELREDVEEQIDHARVVGKKAVRRTIKAAKKRATSASRKATGARKTAKKRATSASRKATGARKTAKKQAASASRKGTGTKKTAKRRATSASRKATGAKKTSRKRATPSPRKAPGARKVARRGARVRS